MAQRVQITVDGVKKTVEAGMYDVHDFISLVKAPATTTSFTVVLPTRPTTVGGNDSLTIVGGEVFTSVHP